jgi:hypothetical protein
MNSLATMNVPTINNLADLCQFIDSVGDIDEAFNRIEAKTNSIYAMEIVGESSGDTISRLTRKFNLLKLSLDDLCKKTNSWCDSQWKKHFNDEILEAPVGFKKAVDSLPLAYKYMLFNARPLTRYYRPPDINEDWVGQPWFLEWRCCHEIQETAELLWEVPEVRHYVGLKKVVSRYGPSEPYNGSKPTKKLIIAETSQEHILSFYLPH